MNRGGLERGAVDPRLADVPVDGPAAPPPGKKSLTDLLPPSGKAAVAQIVIDRPPVPKHKPVRQGPAAAPAEDPFALHITLTQPQPVKREVRSEALAAIERESAPPPAPPAAAPEPADGE